MERNVRSSENGIGRTVHRLRRLGSVWFFYQECTLYYIVYIDITHTLLDLYIHISPRSCTERTDTQRCSRGSAAERMSYHCFIIFNLIWRYYDFEGLGEI